MKKKTNTLKHTLRDLDNYFNDAYESYGNGFMYLTEEGFKQIIHDRTALLEMAGEIMYPQCKWYRMGTGTIAARNWIDRLFKKFIMDCIEAGASKETMLWVDRTAGITFDPPIDAGEDFVKSYWDKINLRRLKQEQKELRKSSSRKRFQWRLML